MKNKPWLWPMLCFLAALPGAFVGVCLGSVIGYSQEMTEARQTHTMRLESHPVFHRCEAVGALLGALPGIAIVTLIWLGAEPSTSAPFRCSHEADEKTVWPPPPKD